MQVPNETVERLIELLLDVHNMSDIHPEAFGLRDELVRCLERDMIDKFELPDEPKNPGKYRMLESGEPLIDGDEYQTEAGGWNSLLHMDGQTGSQLPHKRYRRPITEPQYRPFKEGDVIERGDQCRYSIHDEWGDCGFGIGHTANDWRNFRKLIK